jgi:hypothetical protein
MTHFLDSPDLTLEEIVEYAWLDEILAWTTAAVLGFMGAFIVFLILVAVF